MAAEQTRPITGSGLAPAFDAVRIPVRPARGGN